jgi:hypothetical protein
MKDKGQRTNAPQGATVIEELEKEFAALKQRTFELRSFL